MERAVTDLESLQAQAGGLDEGEVDLDERHESVATALADAQDKLALLQADEREAERDRSTWAARHDALALSLARKDGSGHLLTNDVPGVLGTVAKLVTVQPGHEVAVAAALGAVADAVAVASPAQAAAALQHLKSHDAGRAGLLVSGACYEDEQWPSLPVGAVWAIDLVEAPSSLRPALTRALRRVAVVGSLDDARRLVETVPDVRAVSADGDLLGADWAAGGSASAPSLLEVQAAVDEASSQHDEADRRHTRLAAEVGQAQTVVANKQAEVHEALAALHDSDARMAALGEQLGLLASAATAAEAEAGRLEQARSRAEEARDRDLSGLAELEERLTAAEQAPADTEPSTELRDRLVNSAADARATEVEARLAVRTGEERAKALAGRAEALERAARQERAHRERLVALRSQRERGAVVAADVVSGAQIALGRIAVSLQQAAGEREAAQAARTITEGELLALRASGRELTQELDRLTDVVHRDEVARAEQRLRIEAL